ncbi:MAG: DNA recombination protein RmuC [Puniceicoccales bacterium]|jgi:DNA recombination protein RmuC|nr:DNA recombination protein RmuC [Puniceicoccales bacterium]
MLIVEIIFGVALLCVSLAYVKKSAKLDIVQRKLAEAEIRLAVANERIEERDNLNQKWQEQFEQLSAKALKDNNEAFLLLAKNSFDALTHEAHNEFGNRVKPIESTLKLFDEKLKTLEDQRQSAYFSLAEQLKLSQQASVALQEETNNLSNALRKPDFRGQWGEMQLRRTVELAGMMEHVDFEEQQHIISSEGQGFRPDMVIKLPNSRTIVVDAKTPLSGYLEAISAKSKSDQQTALGSFATQIKRHIEKLSSKHYWQQFENCPEFVILFLPGESFLGDAFRANGELLEFGAEKRVILATPATLIAILKAISYGWKQACLANEAREIAEVGKEMYARLKVFFEHFNGMGKSLANTVEAFNKMRTSADSRLVPQGKRFQELGIGSEEISIVGELDQPHSRL